MSILCHFSVRILQLQGADFCLATSDCSVSALTYKLIYFFSPQYQSNWANEESLAKT